MPLQLFGRDQVFIHYDDSGNIVLDTEEPSEMPLLSKIRYRIRRLQIIILDFKIYKVTIIHWFLLFIWFSLLWKFTYVYRDLYLKTAWVATMCTNVILFGCSDILAQSISCYLSTIHIDPIPSIIEDTTNSIMGQLVEPNDLENGDDTGNIDGGYESDNYSIFNEYGIPPAGNNINIYDDDNELAEFDLDTEESTRFDFWRWLCFMGWGAFVSNFQVPWYKFLNYFYTQDPTVVQVLERVLSDQLVYSPIFLYLFFMYSNYVMEGGNARTFSRKIQKLYISTLGCNLLVWPIAQFINFLIMPKHFQVPFSSSVGVLWNCFLSMRNASNSL